MNIKNIELEPMQRFVLFQIARLNPTTLEGEERGAFESLKKKHLAYLSDGRYKATAWGAAWVQMHCE